MDYFDGFNADNFYAPCYEVILRKEDGMRKIFKNNRIIKVLKLIGYILFYIALFLGVIIAINYIEGNGWLKVWNKLK